MSLESFWAGFEKQAGLAQAAGNAVKSVGATLTNLGATGAGKAVSGAASSVTKGVGRVTNTVNQMSTAGKLGLGVAAGVAGTKMLSGRQQQQYQQY